MTRSESGGSSAPKLKNRVFIALVVISNTVGNLFIAIGMKAMPDFTFATLLHYAASLFLNVWIVVGILLLILWMAAQLSMFSWADLTYVLPVTASAYILTAILGKFFLNENISAARWAGVVVISSGVLLVSRTPPRDEPDPEGEHP